MTQDATHKIVDALLTLIFTLGPWPCLLCFYPQRLAIRWLWVTAMGWPLDYTRCNTPHGWYSADALLTLCWRSVDTLLTLCWHSVDTLLTLCWHSVDTLLTLCWHPVDVPFRNGSVTMSLSALPIKAANSLIMDNNNEIVSQFTYLQDWKSWTLCWRWFLEWDSPHVAISLAYKRCGYIGYG